MNFNFSAILITCFSINIALATGVSINQTNSSYSEILIQTSITKGLEDLQAKTLVDSADFDHFIEQALKTPYLVPNFCEEFESFKNGLIWSKPNHVIIESCRKQLVEMISPFMNGDFTVRTIFYSGVDEYDQDYEKFLFMAENSMSSYVMEFQIIQD
ncbi:MAG: hypothetical protein CME64_05670 [Halobacteriovoraceae bacterium]|nr:hypothetical protein [Halobacteriovoraceae bacterium]